jgi:hypothetical protein
VEAILIGEQSLGGSEGKTANVHVKAVFTAARGVVSFTTYCFWLIHFMNFSYYYCVLNLFMLLRMPSSRKTAFFIVTAVKASNLTLLCCCWVSFLMMNIFCLKGDFSSFHYKFGHGHSISCHLCLQVMLKVFVSVEHVCSWVTLQHVGYWAAVIDYCPLQNCPSEWEPHLPYTGRKTRIRYRNFVFANLEMIYGIQNNGWNYEYCNSHHYKLQIDHLDGVGGQAVYMEKW